MNQAHRDQLDELRRRLAELEPYPWSAVESWIAAATPLVRAAFRDHLDDFHKVTEPPRWTALPRVVSGGGVWDEHPRRDNFAEAAAAESSANKRKAGEARDRILAFLDSLIRLADDTSPGVPVKDATNLIHSFLDRFALMTRVLRSRQRQREPLAINDEYDVQYVVGALLALVSDDVRPEEWTPSYAGGASRADFLLKAEKIVVETKFARTGHADREIADELIVDKARYQAHADCRTLFCFVYDPNHALKNAVALQRDLSEEGPIPVHVIVRPR